MIDAQTDLLPGQIDFSDRKPANYSSPDGYFLGTAYNWSTGEVIPEYNKSTAQTNLVLPTNHTLEPVFMKELEVFVKSLVPVYTYPQQYNRETYIGFEHKLTQMEVANNMIAYRDYGYVSLDNNEVQRIIKQQFQELKGSNVFTKNSSSLANFSELEVYDKDTGIYVCSFQNGVDNNTIRKLFTIDLQLAINTIQRLVTVPISKSPFAALISLAFDVKEKRLINSNLIMTLNKQHYNKVASHFLDFSSIIRKDKEIVNHGLYNKRLAEAELFSTL